MDAPLKISIQNNGLWELIRRLLLVLLALSGIWLMMLVQTSFITLTAVDYAREQRDIRAEAFGTPLPEKQRLKGLPLDQYIVETTGGGILPVGEGEGESFFTLASQASSGRWEDAGMSWRISRDSVYWGTRGSPVPVFFLPDENQVSSLAQSLTPDNRSLTLSLGSGAEAKYLRVDLHDYSDDLGPFRVISPAPPDGMLHPYRRIGIVLLGLGLLFYLIIPPPRRFLCAVCYPRWRIVMGDAASLLLLLPFYWIPMLINGGAVQALTGWWGLTLFLWLFSLTGLYLLYINSWYASYQILILPEALLRYNLLGWDRFIFSDMVSIRPLVYKPPRWLVCLSWAMVFLPSSNIALAAANAIQVTNSDYMGVVITLEDGRRVCIWYTDQMGSEMLPGVQRIVEAIKKAGIKEEPEPLVTSKFILY